MNSSPAFPPEHPRGRYLAALRHWSFHVSISAAPSFTFALSGQWRHPHSVGGMLLGVLFFIALYTALARWTFPREVSGSLWRRALRVGTWIRTIWATMAFLGLLTSVREGKWFTLPFTPDIWAGFLACRIVEWFGTLPPVRWLRILLTGPDPAVRNMDPWFGNMISFWPTFLITVVEGLILSAALFLIAFACLAVLRLVARRRCGKR